MLSLNDRAWKEFTFEQLFIVKRGQSVYKQYMKRGNIPYVSASASNNGITDYVDKPNRAANMISLAYDGSVGSAFYQNTPWFASEKIVSIELKDQPLNRYIAMFLCRVIHNQKDKYNYAYKWSVGIRMMRSKILVPITDDGQPDYAFMEQYIREREDKLKQKYIDFIGDNYDIGGVLPSLENKAWAVFNLKDLFDIIQRGKRLVREHQQAGTMPYVSSTAMNNGIDGFISTERTTREFSNCLTIANSGSVGSSFYQPSKFIASDHITHLKNDSYTMYVYLFIATMTKRMSEKYNFNREINDYRISKEKILLPTTDEGSPDYEYMEQYIKAVMFGKYKKYLEYAQK